MIYRSYHDEVVVVTYFLVMAINIIINSSCIIVQLIGVHN